MLLDNLRENELFKELEDLVSPLGYHIVDSYKNEKKGETELTVLVVKKGNDITLDDLEILYNLIYPRYQAKWDRSLTLEVSSAGMNRNIKDVYEFQLFKGKDVKVYSNLYSAYVYGKIDQADDEKVILSSVSIPDKKSTMDKIEMNLSDIQKARLESLEESGK